MANEGPSLTKATYDKKRPRKPVPSPGQRQAELEERKRVAAKSRQFDKRVKKDGPVRALFPDIAFPTEKPNKRRKMKT